MNEKINQIIKSHVLWAMGGGLIPVPLLDIIAVGGIQVDMIRKIATEYGHNPSEDQAKVYIGALSGGVAARLGANALKLIPGVGSVIGGVSMAAMSGASTYAIGKVMQSHFEAGGSTGNFDPARFKDFYDDQIRKGKDFVENLRNENKEEETQTTSKADPQTESIISRLKELSDMKEAGILSEEEFKGLKAKILQNF